MAGSNLDECTRELHHRLVEGDTLASSKLIETLIEELVTRVSARARTSRESTLVVDAVTDSLLTYVQHPEKYNPSKSSLVSYLTMSAYRDYLNSLERERRRTHREISIENVEHLSSVRNNWIESFERRVSDSEGLLTSSERKKVWMCVLEQFPDSKDRRILNLMLEGERKTAAYSKILGLQDSDYSEQQRVVKRNKDRINKRLLRLGDKLRKQND